MGKLEGYCNRWTECQNSGIQCEICTESWYYEEPQNHFREIERVEELPVKQGICNRCGEDKDLNDENLCSECVATFR